MTPHDDELLAEIRRLNINIEALLSASQGQLLARAQERPGQRVQSHTAPAALAPRPATGVRKICK